MLDIVNGHRELSKKCKLHFEGSLGCYMVTDVEDTSLPPHSEVVMKGQVSNSKEGDYIIEPSEKFVEYGCASVARTLVKESKNKKIPARLINPTDQV